MRFGILLAALLGGCNNPCQQLCLEIADYASECGYTVSSEDLSTCRSAYAGTDQGEACATSLDADVREWWTCDDVAENFQKSQ
jgi:hypothetical protein